MSTIKVIIKEPFKEAKVTEIKNDLKTLQKIVDGLIQVIPFPEVENVDLILNDEGKLLDFDGNIELKEYKDCICGTLIACGFTNDGENASLNDKQIKDVMSYIDKNKFNSYNDWIKYVNNLLKSDESQGEM